MLKPENRWRFSPPIFRCASVSFNSVRTGNTCVPAEEVEKDWPRSGGGEPPFRGKKECYKALIRAGWGMNAELGVLVGGFFVQTLLIWYYKNELLRNSDEKMMELDEKLAQAIIQVAEGAAMGGAERPNPMQMMLMQLLQQRMQPKSPETGQFIEASPGSEKI